MSLDNRVYYRIGVRSNADVLAGRHHCAPAMFENHDVSRELVNTYVLSWAVFLVLVSFTNTPENRQSTPTSTRR